MATLQAGPAITTYRYSDKTGASTGDAVQVLSLGAVDQWRTARLTAAHLAALVPPVQSEEDAEVLAVVSRLFALMDRNGDGYVSAPELRERRCEAMGMGQGRAHHLPPPRPSLPAVGNSPPKWTADKEAPKCQLCRADFNLLNWRHVRRRPCAPKAAAAVLFS